MKIPVAEDGDGEEVQAVERSVACLSALDLGVGLGLEQQVVAFVALVRKWGSGYVAGEEKVVMVHNLSLRGRGGYVWRAPENCPGVVRVPESSYGQAV